MMYFPRMLDKIRLHLRGELHEDYQENFGALKAADGVCCNFLRVHHRDLIRTREAGRDRRGNSGMVFRKGPPLERWRSLCLERIRIEARMARFSHADSSNNEKRRWESPIATIFSAFQTSSISTKGDFRTRAKLRERKFSSNSRRRSCDLSLRSGFQRLPV